MISFVRTAESLHGKRVIVRVDVNIPIAGDVIKDDFRIRRILPTLELLRERGAVVIAISHHSDKTQSLRPVAEYLSRRMKTVFVPDPFREGAFGGGEHGTVYVCENLRFFKGEEGNDAVFAKKLASLGDVYVNDAFAVSHREHASIVSLPKLLPSYAGILFEEEIKNLSVAFDPPRPSLFIFGGKKAKTKLPLVEKCTAVSDALFIGGALANNCFKDQGFEVGTSVVENVTCDTDSLIGKDGIFLPDDVVVKNNEGVFVKKPSEVLEGDKIVDAGPETISRLKGHVADASFILWNGPLGDIEAGFLEGTLQVLDAIVKSDSKTVVGGGDTVSVISGAGKESAFGFISTGGGAMLQFLLERTLPGIKALEGVRSRQ